MIHNLAVFLAAVAVFVTAATVIRRYRTGPRRTPWTNTPRGGDQ